MEEKKMMLGSWRCCSSCGCGGDEGGIGGVGF